MSLKNTSLICWKLLTEDTKVDTLVKQKYACKKVLYSKEKQINIKKKKSNIQIYDIT